MNPFVNIHTHNSRVDNKEFIEIINIDVDNLVNVDVNFLYSIGIHPWNSGIQEFRGQGFRSSGWSVPEPVEGTMFSASTSSATLIQELRKSFLKTPRG